jgi:hypothetical protein
VVQVRLAHADSAIFFTAYAEIPVWVYSDPPLRKESKVARGSAPALRCARDLVCRSWVTALISHLAGVLDWVPTFLGSKMRHLYPTRAASPQSNVSNPIHRVSISTSKRRIVPALILSEIDRITSFLIYEYECREHTALAKTSHTFGMSIFQLHARAPYHKQDPATNWQRILESQHFSTAAPHNGGTRLTQTQCSLLVDPRPHAYHPS